MALEAVLAHAADDLALFQNAHQTLLKGAMSGTKILSCVPNLTTTLPSPASTTSPTPNLACLTLSPALYTATPDVALSGLP